MLREWHGYTADDLLNYWFNGLIFHQTGEKAQGVRGLLRRMNEDVAHHLVTEAIYERMLVLRNIRWVLHPLTTDSQCIRVPEQYA